MLFLAANIGGLLWQGANDPNIEAAWTCASYLSHELFGAVRLQLSYGANKPRAREGRLLQRCSLKLLTGSLPLWQIPSAWTFPWLAGFFRR